MVSDFPDPTQGGEGQVDGHAKLIVLVDDPVEPGHAVHFVLGVATNKDIVTAFPNEFIEAAAADEDVVATHIVQQERVHIVAVGTILGALLDPVVALVAGHCCVDFGAEHEVVTRAPEDLRNVLGGDDEVAAGAGEDQVDAGGGRVAGLNDVVAVVTMYDVVAAQVRDDVVASATQDLVVAVTALEPVIASVAIERVVANARDDDVIARGAAEDDMVF